MPFSQRILDEAHTDSIPFISGLLRVGSSGAEAEDWTVQFLRELGQISLKRRRSEPHYMTTYPEVFVYEAPRHESTTTSTDFEAHLAPGDETSSVEGDILRGEFVGPRPTPSSTLSRIKARQPQILHRAMEIRQEYGDPIQSLAALLENMPGSQEDWEALIDEPYY
jgi:hypothetical protein